MLASRMHQQQMHKPLHGTSSPHSQTEGPPSAPINAEERLPAPTVVVLKHPEKVEP